MEKDSYQTEKEELRKMHMERMARLNKKEEFQIDDCDKLLKKIETKKESIQTNQIWLNTIIYDKRKPSEKHNNVTFANFLHENVTLFPMRPMSKNIQAIMITTYGYEPEVFDPIIHSGVPFYIFNREVDSKEGSVKRKYSGFDNVTLISPPKLIAGYGVFHTKLWLIKFKTFLRVVVCTGNHHLYDWTVWQNAYWYHDCKLINKEQKQVKIGSNFEDVSQKEPIQTKKVTDFNYSQDFVQTLKWVISQMSPKDYNVLKEMNIEFSLYSFEGINAILIPSLPGRFKGEAIGRVGIGKIKKVMLQTKQCLSKAKLTCNCSSLGKLDQKFLREVYFAFTPNTFNFSIQDFRLVYPSKKYIEQQTCQQAGILFLTSENYAKCQFKNQLFHEYRGSVKNGVVGGIPHLKTIIIDDSTNENYCHLYLGSHNLTRAAWGSYQKNDSQISCSNSQLGLLFLNYNKSELMEWLPYEYPPKRYEKNEKPFIRDFE